MPKGIYKRKPFTEEHKRNIGKYWIGNIRSKESRMKQSLSTKGRKRTRESINSGILTMKLKRLNGYISPLVGRKHSEETKKKMSESKRGKNNPMFGKRGNLSSLYGIRRFGKDNPFFGKHHTPENVEKIRKRIITKETRKKIGLSTLKRYNSGEIFGFKKTRKYQILPIKNTSIEVKIQDFLTLLKIEFFTHKYMKIKHGYQCDILIPKQETEGVIIPQKTIIECDGDYFHMNPNKFKPEDKCFKNGATAKEIWKLDNNRTKELQEKGFRVIRLWEHEIKVMELNDFKNKVHG